MIVINGFLVALGAAFGGVARYSLSTWLNQKQNSDFPYATFLINLVGSFLLGFIFGKALPQYLQFFLGVGFMGGFTTFSTFKVESIQLYLQKKYVTLSMYIAFTYLLGIFFAVLGWFVGRKII